MSWLDKVSKDYVITLTVGERLSTAKRVDYKPNWLNAARTVEYNIAEFNFKNQRGTLVRRGTPMGTRYDLEIYFQGENNLDVATKFLNDAQWQYPWQINHPMYGGLYVQPMSLRLDDSSFNVTRVTGTVMETLGANNRPRIDIDPIDVVKTKKLDTDIVAARAYEVAIPEALASDVSQMQTNASFLEAGATAFATITEDAQAARNAYNRAFADINNALDGTFNAIRSIQDLINLPATFASSVNTRVAYLYGKTLDLYATISTLVTPRQKRLYENNVGTLVTSMCFAATTNVTQVDYRNRNDVIQVFDYIITGYNKYLNDLDILQTSTGDTPDSYVPDFDVLVKIGDVVKYTGAWLLSLSETAAQQRVYRTEQDTNIILMAYKFYGLLPDDSTIDRVISENNIGLNEILQIKKGRDLVYYVGI